MKRLLTNVALAEWLRRVPAKYMGFPRESSNLSGDVYFFVYFLFPSFPPLLLKKAWLLNFNIFLHNLKLFSIAIHRIKKICFYDNISII